MLSGLISGDGPYLWITRAPGGALIGLCRHVTRGLLRLFSLSFRHDRGRGGLGRLCQGRVPPRTHRRRLLRRKIPRRQKAWLGPFLHRLARKGHKVSERLLHLRFCPFPSSLSLPLAVVLPARAPARPAPYPPRARPAPSADGRSPPRAWRTLPAFVSRNLDRCIQIGRIVKRAILPACLRVRLCLSSGGQCSRARLYVADALRSSSAVFASRLEASRGATDPWDLPQRAGGLRASPGRRRWSVVVHAPDPSPHRHPSFLFVRNAWSPSSAPIVATSVYLRDLAQIACGWPPVDSRPAPFAGTLSHTPRSLPHPASRLRCHIPDMVAATGSSEDLDSKGCPPDVRICATGDFWAAPLRIRGSCGVVLQRGLCRLTQHVHYSFVHMRLQGTDGPKYTFEHFFIPFRD